MTVDGIPETLPPVAATGEQARFRATEPRPAGARRRLPTLPDEEGLLEPDADDNHALDDLA